MRHFMFEQSELIIIVVLCLRLCLLVVAVLGVFGAIPLVPGVVGVFGILGDFLPGTARTSLTGSSTTVLLRACVVGVTKAFTILGCALVL